MNQPYPLVAGNWKMNGLRDSVKEVEKLCHRLGEAGSINAEIMICPPALLVGQFCQQLASSGILIGGQDCHSEASGAHTGDIAAEMLSDAGASAVLTGHSERRADHGETNAEVCAKASAAHRAGLTAIICVGETQQQREGGQTLDVISKQLSGSIPPGTTAQNSVIAYEPVWAIGTGLTPTLDDVGEVHAHIRTQLAATLGQGDAHSMRILYGGSVKPGNAAELMAVENVNGALVGGASLRAEDFWGIISVYAKS